LFNVVSLCVRKLELSETAARLCRIVVCDRGLEPLAERRRLRELPA
jgi:hypothetical protein